MLSADFAAPDFPPNFVPRPETTVLNRLGEVDSLCIRFGVACDGNQGEQWESNPVSITFCASQLVDLNCMYWCESERRRLPKTGGDMPCEISASPSCSNTARFVFRLYI